jgi:hypothetical protein
LLFSGCIHDQSHLGSLSSSPASATITCPRSVVFESGPHKNPEASTVLVMKAPRAVLAGRVHDGSEKEPQFAVLHGRGEGAQLPHHPREWRRCRGAALSCSGDLPESQPLVKCCSRAFGPITSPRR